jgi:leader peptidase (prepilin peptidase)/N-methyltransferase
VTWPCAKPILALGLAIAVAFSCAVLQADAAWPLRLVSLAFGWTLAGLAWIDARCQVLPDIVVLPLIPAGLAVTAVVGAEALVDHAGGAMAGYAAFSAIATVYRRVRARDGLGGGDAKLLAAGGAWVSWSGLPSVVLVACLSALCALLIQSFGGRRPALDDRLAFGPHLALGLWIVWLCGPLTIF